MEIDLKGYKVLIDDEDYEKVIARTWRIHTYNLKRGLFYFLSHDGKHTVLMHRLIMGCVLHDGMVVDHINGNTLDCRKSNMRICTSAENSRNTGKNKINKSGYKGVFYISRIKRYRASISVNRKHIMLGCYKTAEEAYGAYCDAAKKYHGEFARMQ